MITYSSINLKDILEHEYLGENAAKRILSQFSCPQNLAVENFLKNSAIEFTKQSISITHLIMALYNGQYILVGYFTLANKALCFTQDKIPSQTWQRRLLKFSQFEESIQRYFISTPLIGQLGKNYTNSYNTLIDGSQLLKLALGKIKEMQRIVGGKIVYLECENDQKIIDFYSQNSFTNFGIHETDNHYSNNTRKEPLVQMLAHLR